MYDGLKTSPTEPILRVTLNGILDPTDLQGGQAYKLLPLPGCPAHHFVQHAGGYSVIVVASAANAALMEAMKRWNEKGELTMMLVDSEESAIYAKVHFSLSKAARLAFKQAAKGTAYSKAFQRICPMLPEIFASSEFAALAIPENVRRREVVCAFL
jgi:hypothetical protein